VETRHVVADFHVLGEDGVRLQGQQQALALVQHVDFLALLIGEGESPQGHHQRKKEGSADRHNRQHTLSAEALLNVFLYS
jgi:hypothetical protein